MLLEIISIVLIAIILAVAFFYGFRRRGPWGSLWAYILILIAGMLSFSIWTEPYGPVLWGIGWIDILIVGILLALLLAAASPAPNSTIPREGEQEILPEEEDTYNKYAIGSFFWVLILLFIVLIIVGMWL